MPSNPIATALVSWFKAQQRPLPWRRSYAPYEVWISEVMLQQTQVSTMLPYFDRWMHALPSIEALAKAPEETILKLWEGLGYYSRALNLKKAAQMLVEGGGELPHSHEELLKLPGIGPYTAAAIASIAFEEPVPVVDGNVMRVLSRLYAHPEDPRKSMEFFWEKACTLLPKHEARAFNQGLMELGALVCTPKKPQCNGCPLRAECQAFAQGKPEAYPIKTVRKKPTPIQVAIGLIEWRGKLYVQKRPKGGLMSGLWEFPGGKITAQENPLDALQREVHEETGLILTHIRPFHHLRHNYTSYQVDLHCFTAQATHNKVRLESATEYRWVTPEELSSLAFPAANGKIIRKWLKHRG